MTPRLRRVFSGERGSGRETLRLPAALQAAFSQSSASSSMSWMLMA